MKNALWIQGPSFRVPTAPRIANQCAVLAACYLAIAVAGCSGAKSNADIAPSSSTTNTRALTLVPQILEKGVEFVPSPNPAPYGSDGSYPIVNVSWNVPKATKTQIHMGSPTGKLFSEARSVGSAVTGAWVTTKAVFYLQDVSLGSPGKTVAVIRVKE